MAADPAAPRGIPKPPAVAARPRDRRGFPVPAITPWADGEPRFAANGAARVAICASERRCSVCGLVMAPGPVWRVVSGREAAAIADAQAAGRAYLNNAPTGEAPGHRGCMLFAAMACPYLARPGARRGAAAQAVGLSAQRGDARGDGGAVAGFGRYQYTYGPYSAPLFRFAGLVELLGHDLGAEHLDALRAEIAAGPADPDTCPGYLLGDEAAAERRASVLWHHRHRSVTQS
ncbi:MAG TPA: hypothetical protein VFU73_14605 [Actinocrinis sp.]|nr:hypothetical protein [Actinocrinis sp.]